MLSLSCLGLNPTYAHATNLHNCPHIWHRYLGRFCTAWHICICAKAERCKEPPGYLSTQFSCLRLSRNCGSDSCESNRILSEVHAFNCLCQDPGPSSSSDSGLRLDQQIRMKNVSQTGYKPPMLGARLASWQAGSQGSFALDLFAVRTPDGPHLHISRPIRVPGRGRVAARLTAARASEAHFSQQETGDCLCRGCW